MSKYYSEGEDESLEEEVSVEEFAADSSEEAEAEGEAFVADEDGDDEPEEEEVEDDEELEDIPPVGTKRPRRSSRITRGRRSRRSSYPEDESSEEPADDDPEEPESAEDEEDEDDDSAQLAAASRLGRRGRGRGRQVNYCEDAAYDELIFAENTAKNTKRKGRSTKAQTATRRTRKSKRQPVEESDGEEPAYDEEEEEAPADSGDEEEEEHEASEEEEGDDEVVEKILAHRYKEDDESEIEYYVKWKDRSYLHVSWVTADEFNKDRFGKSKLLRYHRKGEVLYDDADEIFNPQFLDVDRVVHHLGEEDNDERFYLVKWQALPYSDATWETPANVGDDEKIGEYWKRNKPLSSKAIKEKARPAPSKWVKYDESPEYKAGHQLRPYQLEGLNWLTFCWYNRRNSILADEMGLGKTVQTVSVVDHLFRHVGIRGPFLIIAPLITVPHWQREFEGWTDMNTVVYHGNTESRQMIRDYEWYAAREGKGKSDKRKGPFKFHTLITTFEMIITDASILSAIEWKYIAVDEAHRLKNKNCKLINVLRTFSFDHLLLLTGTPLQNNTEELWTLLNLMDPDKFESLDDFMDKFGALKETSQVEDLHKVLRPYLLRRMKEDVEKSIAPKEETIIEVELTTIQKQYYRAIFEKNFSSLQMGSKASNVPSLLNVMMQLRKCCNHPYLLRGVEENILRSHSATTPAASSSSSSSGEGASEDNQLMIKSSGKLVLIDKLLAKLKAQGHKVLIFSQMVRMLDILEDHMIFRQYAYERIDGSKRGNERQAAIDRFSAPDSDRFVFLLCTRAGGLGINLTAADTCIIYDSDWNPQNDIQAQARCHRIGQTQMVKIYRLITRNTYEKKMFEKASLKLGLDQAVLTKMKSSGTPGTAASAKANLPLNNKEVDELLKYGAYGAFDETPGTDQYDEEDIDKILERSTTVVVGGDTDTQDPANKALSSFSKASFVSADAESYAHIDVADPNFWQKLMPEASYQDPLVQCQPRQRKQVQRYGIMDEYEMAAIGGGGANNSDSDSELEEYEETHEDPPDDGALGWSNRDRNRLRTQLQTFGYGQWHTIRKAAGLERYQVAEVEAYSDALIRKLVEYLGEEAEGTLDFLRRASIPERYVPGAVAATIPPPEEEDDEEHEHEHEKDENESAGHPGDSKNGLTEEGVTVVAPPPPPLPPSSDDAMDVTPAVPSVKQEEDEQDNQEQPMDEEPAPSESSQESAPPASSDDVDMAEASETSENEQASAPASQDEGGAEASQEDKENGEGDSDEVVLHASQLNFEDDGTLKGHDFREYAKRNAKLIVRRLESIAKVCKHTVDCIRLFGETPPIPKVPGDVCESWGDEDDRSLILGTYYHGYHRFAEMRMDPRLTFTRFMDVDEVPVNIQNDPRLDALTDEQKEAAKAATDKETWPSEKVINRRLRKTLRLILMAHAGKSGEDGDGKVDRRQRRREISTEWSKREKLDFYRVITTYGITNTPQGEPDWEEFQQRAKLTRKTHDMIREYAEALYTQSGNAMTMGKEYDALRKRLLPLLEAGESRAAKTQLKELGDVQWLAAGDPTLSLAQCKRILLRTKLFKELREQLLPVAHRFADLLRGTRVPSGFPAWWRPEVHDLALVQSVTKHGFGQWEKICSDPEFPFYELAMERLKESGKLPAEADKASASGGEASPRGGHEDEDSGKEDDGEGDNDDDTPAPTGDGTPTAPTPKRRRKRGRQVEVYTTALDFPKEKVLSKRLEFLSKTITQAQPTATQRRLSISSICSPATLEHSVKKATVKKEPVKREPLKKEYTDVPRTSTGEPVFPIIIGKMRVESLGAIVTDRAEYHTPKYIWPVGYRSVRIYQSFVTPLEKTEYVSEILDGGERPLFRVTAKDAPDRPSEGNSATGAWSTVLKQAKSALETLEGGEKKPFNPVSGTEYFGLAKGIIRKLIQELPGAEKCESYTPIVFAESDAPPKRPRKKRKLNEEEGAPDNNGTAPPTGGAGGDPKQTTLSFGVRSASGSRVSILN